MQRVEHLTPKFPAFVLDGGGTVAKLASRLRRLRLMATAKASVMSPRQFSLCVCMCVFVNVCV